MSDLALGNREYWQEIRDIAASAMKEPEDERTDHVDYLMSEHEFIIYTGKALAVLLHSPNESEYFDEFGEFTATDFHQVVSMLAEAAMRRDVYEAIAQLQAEQGS